MATRFRGLPAVDRVLSDRRVRRLVKEYSHGAVQELIRAQLDEARAATKALIHDNARVTRVMIVDAADGAKFVEWIERS